MITKNCEVCGKSFNVFPAAAKRRRTCSKKCGLTIRQIAQKHIVCKNCGILVKGNNRVFCSVHCCAEFKRTNCKKRDKELLEDGKLKSRYRIKPLLLERDGNICSKCKNTIWLNQPITLWVDHIDGNATNNNLTNLRLICPNCDSQSETFMAKNKGNGRKSRGLQPWE